MSIKVRDPDDEIWAENDIDEDLYVHIERMDNDYIWIGLTKGGKTTHVDITTGPKCRHKVRMNVRD